MVVISVPYAAYQDAHDIDNLRLLGFHVTDEMASSTAPDEATKTACQLAGVEFETVTGSFRTWADQGRLFFEYDSHFNADGHRKFAELLTPEINRIIKGERTP